MNEDRPWLAALIVLALIVAAILLWTRHPHAASAVGAVTIHGKIEATEDEATDGHFTIVPEGEGDYVSLSVTGYLVDWFNGSIGHPVTVTIQPQ